MRYSSRWQSWRVAPRVNSRLSTAGSATLLFWRAARAAWRRCAVWAGSLGSKAIVIRQSLSLAWRDGHLCALLQRYPAHRPMGCRSALSLPADKGACIWGPLADAFCAFPR